MTQIARIIAPMLPDKSGQVDRDSKQSESECLEFKDVQDYMTQIDPQKGRCLRKIHTYKPLTTVEVAIRLYLANDQVGQLPLSPIPLKVKINPLRGL